MDLNVRVEEKENGIFLVAPSGRLDTGTAPILKKEIARVVLKAPRALILDMEGVDYISSMGVREIIQTRKKLSRIGGMLRVVNLRPPVKRVFEIIRALPPEDIFESVEEMDRYLDVIQREVREE